MQGQQDIVKPHCSNKSRLISGKSHLEMLPSLAYFKRAKNSIQKTQEPTETEGRWREQLLLYQLSLLYKG